MVVAPGSPMMKSSSVLPRCPHLPVGEELHVRGTLEVLMLVAMQHIVPGALLMSR